MATAAVYHCRIKTNAPPQQPPQSRPRQLLCNTKAELGILRPRAERLWINPRLVVNAVAASESGKGGGGTENAAAVSVEKTSAPPSPPPARPSRYERECLFC